MTLTDIERALAEAGIDSPRFDALTLAEAFTSYSRASLMADRARDIATPELESAVRRRIAREPLQYIIGQWDFMGATLTVTPHCLIPRDDTEVLARAAIAELIQIDNPRFADLCTGSGCVAIAILMDVPAATCDAVELIPETAAIARENARRNGVADRMNVTVGDVMTGDGGDGYDIITANPPYITAEEMTHLAPELSYEPRVALTDEGDGLSVIKGIIDGYIPRLAPRGKLLIEIGADEGEAVRLICAERELSCTVLKDTGDRDRVAVVLA